MNKRNYLTRIAVKGGVLSPSELMYIAEATEKLGLETISLGARQDIMFPEKIDREKLAEFDKISILTPEEHDVENIVTSYVSAGIFTSRDWLTPDLYLYILEQFKGLPKLKVNITDPEQRIVPLFNGHLNFIASIHEDYWYLYVRLSHWEEAKMYPALIYSWDIATISEAIEDLMIEDPHDVEMLFILVSDACDTNNRTVDRELKVSFELFPYYEGMHRMGNNEYWLGLYWRNNRYNTDFLKAMCQLCSDCEIGKISITPWKSFIVKGIDAKHKLSWEKLLGRYGINVRHSNLELNWHLPVDDAEALKLKKYLVQNFDQNDTSTYGLTFGIVDHDPNYFYFTSIVIEKNRPSESIRPFGIRDTYNLLYAERFDPNSRHYLSYVQDVDMVDLPGLLMEMSKMYFEQLGSEKDEVVTGNVVKNPAKERIVFQCKNCLTVYEEAYGDDTQQVESGVPFENLPESYECSLCGSPKSDFKQISLSKLSQY